MLESLQLKHEAGGSVKEWQVGAMLGEVTEPNKMTLRVEKCWKACNYSMISKRVASRCKVRDVTEREMITNLIN